MAEESDYVWNTDAVTQQLEAVSAIRDYIRAHGKLIAEPLQDAALPVKPGIKTLKNHHWQCAPFAIGMRESKHTKATPIDPIIDILSKLLGMHGIKPDARTLHVQSWDLKNLLTYMRGLWVRQKERPVTDIALLVEVSRVNHSL